MWVITSLGFFSIVCKPGDAKAGTLTIRARVKADLEALRKQALPTLGPISENMGSDYRFRAKAKREDVVKALTKIVEQIDYENFKDKVAETQGYKRAEIYEGVWSTLYDLQAS